MTKSITARQLSDHPVCFCHTTLKAYVDFNHLVNVEGRIIYRNYVPAQTAPEVRWTLAGEEIHWSGHLNPHPHVLPL